MKITTCGSIAFYDQMQKTRNVLEQAGHEVKLPPSQIKDNAGRFIPVKHYYEIRKASQTTSGWIWDRKTEAIRAHFDKVAWSDAILVLNYTKNNIAGYVGTNTLLEMGLAFYLNKKIYLLNPLPDMPYTEEILGMKPVVLNGKLNKI